jgi:hypothetical protein
VHGQEAAAPPIDRIAFDARHPTRIVRYRIGEAAPGGMAAISQHAKQVLGGACERFNRLFRPTPASLSQHLVGSSFQKASDVHSRQAAPKSVFQEE